MQEDVHSRTVDPRLLRWLPAILLSSFVLVIDLLTKEWLFANAPLMQKTASWIVFRFTDHHNFGITFDIPVPSMLIIITTALVMGLVFYGIYRAFHRASYAEIVALSLLFWGAAGNLLDRIAFGYVRDWMLFFGRSAMNVADFAIIFGLAWYLLNKQRDSNNRN